MMQRGQSRPVVLLSSLECLLLAACSGGCTSSVGTGESPPPDDLTPPTPIISTVIGNGVAGDNGDGLPGTETALYLPQDVSFGPDGRLYVADWNNHRIRRVADGVVESPGSTGRAR